MKNYTHIISQIANRATERLPIDKLSIMMDVQAVHDKYGLDLDSLLKADDFNFFHDIVGINNNLDRETKSLTNCFLPRFCKGKE